MRVMLDTNVLVSAAVLSSRHILPLLDELAVRHTIVLSTYVVTDDGYSAVPKPSLT